MFYVASGLVLCLVAAVSFARYVQMSLTDGLLLLGVAEMALLAAFGWSSWHWLRFARPISEWISAGRPAETAPEVWLTAIRLPEMGLRLQLWRAVLVAGLPVTVFAALRFDLGVDGAAVVMAAMLTAASYPTVLHYFALEYYLRPLLYDIAERLPYDFEIARTRVPIRRKTLSALVVMNVVTAMFAAVYMAGSDAAIGKLGIAVLIALAVALTGSMLLSMLFAHSFLAPVADLLAATERVKRGDIWARVPVTTEDELGVLASSFNGMMRALTEREILREALSSYVAPDVAHRVGTEGERLRAHEAAVTLLFVDIRDFTAYSERASSADAIRRLDAFFDLVVPIVKRHGGHVNKFVGDGLLAVYGLTEPRDDHADRALATAWAIAQAIDETYRGELDVGMGLNSGDVLAGTVGGGGRLEYMLIGDAVNVASRVERLTRDTGDRILLTEATRELMRDPPADVEPRGEITVKGKLRPLRVYALRRAGVGPGTALLRDYKGLTTPIRG